MDESSQLLPYADPPAQSGIVVEHFSDYFRMTVPAGGWRALPIGYKISIPLLLCALVGMSCEFLVNASAPLEVMLPPFLMYLVTLTIVLGYAARRWRQRMTIELDSEQLRLINNRPGQTKVWSRRIVSLVKRNPSSDLLMIQFTGHPFVEVFVSGEASTTDWAVEQLTIALKNLPISRASTFDAPSEYPPPMRSGPARSVLVGISLLFAGIGIVMVFLGTPWTSMSFGLFLVASIPAGLAMGMQDKDFFT